MEVLTGLTGQGKECGRERGKGHGAKNVYEIKCRGHPCLLTRAVGNVRQVLRILLKVGGASENLSKFILLLL